MALSLTFHGTPQSVAAPSLSVAPVRCGESATQCKARPVNPCRWTGSLKILAGPLDRSDIFGAAFGRRDILRVTGQRSRGAAARVRAALSTGDLLPDLGPLETDESIPETKKTVSLKEELKESGVVLFVYPKADTSGCTKQACAFRDKLPEFAAAGYKIFGLSADAPASQAAWKGKQGYPYSLLSDPSHQALKVLGVSDGVAITRSHFIVEKGGEIKDARIGISSGESVPEALKAIGLGPSSDLKSFKDA